MMKKENEIRAVLDKLSFSEEKKKTINERFFSMTYADGLEEALNWVLGEGDLEDLGLEEPKKKEKA